MTFMIRQLSVLISCLSVLTAETARSAPHAEAAVIHCQSSRLAGRWRFTGILYEDRRWPIPNPDLMLEFTFDSDGHNRLSWTRPGSRCQRAGRYLYDQCTLMDLVVEVDPGNTPDCARDPDMRPRRLAVTRLDFSGDEMRLHLSLSGRPLVYLWTRHTAEEASSAQAHEQGQMVR